MTLGLKWYNLICIWFSVTDDSFNNSVLVSVLPCVGRGDYKSLLGDGRACDRFMQQDPLTDSLV